MTGYCSLYHYHCPMSCYNNNNSNNNSNNNNNNRRDLSAAKMTSLSTGSFLTLLPQLFLFLFLILILPHRVRLSTPTSTVQGHYITCVTVTLTNQEHDQIFSSDQYIVFLATWSRTRSRKRLSCRLLCCDSVSFFDSSDGRCSCRGRCFQNFATGRDGSGRHSVSVCSRGMCNYQATQ